MAGVEIQPEFVLAKRLTCRSFLAELRLFKAPSIDPDHNHRARAQTLVVFHLSLRGRVVFTLSGMGPHQAKIDKVRDSSSGSPAVERNDVLPDKRELQRMQDGTENLRQSDLEDPRGGTTQAQVEDWRGEDGEDERDDEGWREDQWEAQAPGSSSEEMGDTRMQEHITIASGDAITTTQHASMLDNSARTLTTSRRILKAPSARAAERNSPL
ncbi:hypothetical protein NM688_g2524 [Phlebia brevispora]|uniref:Uncharacterized protein n=1 Tax=Phlebia brevispora TaxID=194682 RepID=A0ACC1T8K4_9APHY|nr:hypothetical protein NM688_g2524 [Phlebia brevispora]